MLKSFRAKVRIRLRNVGPHMESMWNVGHFARG